MLLAAGPHVYLIAHTSKITNMSDGPLSFPFFSVNGPLGDVFARGSLVSLFSSLLSISPAASPCVPVVLVGIVIRGRFVALCKRRRQVNRSTASVLGVFLLLSCRLPRAPVRRESEMKRNQGEEETNTGQKEAVMDQLGLLLTSLVFIFGDSQGPVPSKIWASESAPEN